MITSMRFSLAITVAIDTSRPRMAFFFSFCQVFFLVNAYTPIWQRRSRAPGASRACAQVLHITIVIIMVFSIAIIPLLYLFFSTCTIVRGIEYSEHERQPISQACGQLG